MIFVHGSKQNLENEGFEVFNYIMGVDGKPTEEKIDNGVDQEGVGIYAWIGDSDESFDNAKFYTSKESSFAYVLEVDIEEEELMHLREPDELYPEDLVSAIELFIEKKRDLLGFNKEKVDNVIEYLEDSFDEIDLEKVNFSLKSNGVNFQIDSSLDPNNFDDFDDWKMEVDENYYTNEPCSNIEDEGGAEAIAEHAINSSENLWQTLKSIGETIAVIHTGLGTESYNKTFQESILETFPESKLTVAYSEDGAFAVIFDTDAIEIKEKVNLHLRDELKEKESVKQEPKKRQRRLRM